MIPYICEELPQTQRDALASAQKVPLLYTNVALRNWTSFQKLKTNAVYAPGCYHTRVALDLAVSIGGYECARQPEQPIVVHMMKTPCQPGRPSREQHTLGRIELYNTTFETMEREIREPTCPDAGRGRIRSCARYCRYHREPLAARIRVRIQLAVGFVLAGGWHDSVRSGEKNFRKDRNRECRRRSLRVYG